MAKSVLRTVGELPSHKHNTTATITTNGNHTHTIRGISEYSANSSDYVASCRPEWSRSDKTTLENGSHSHTVTVNISNSGSGNAHNNMAPYLAVYMWRRIG